MSIGDTITYKVPVTIPEDVFEVPIIVTDTIDQGLTLNEDSANTAYELTFLIVGICCAIYTLGIKKQKLVFKQEVPKYAGALCETAGQYAYIYALADEAHVALAAPIISAYCVLSVVWSRLILKEKLSFKHYAAIVIVVIGIVILGLYDA